MNTYRLFSVGIERSWFSPVTGGRMESMVEEIGMAWTEPHSAGRRVRYYRPGGGVGTESGFATPGRPSVVCGYRVRVAQQSYRGWLVEDDVPDGLSHERRGHRRLGAAPGARGIYSHVNEDSTTATDTASRSFREALV